MRGFFEDVCVPVILFGLIAFAFCQAGVSYYCVKIGDMYELNSKTVMLECYVETPKGWMASDDYRLAKLLNQF